MIPIIEITQREITRRPLMFFTRHHEGYDGRWKLMKQATEYSYDNNKTMWSNINGHLHSISILKGVAGWEINLWDDTGSLAIGQIKQDMINAETDVLSNENYAKMDKMTKDFHRGTVRCSGCGKDTNSKNNPRRFYAGIYCESCWEGKYKAMEAKENYD